MYLRDLFRYRTTDNKVNREDFLSACLAELMRRDEAVCAAVLGAVGFKNLPALTAGGYAVRTQVGKADGNTMRWCDILVELRGGRRLLMECKVGAPPDLDQIKRYRELWGTQDVALLTREGSRPSDMAGWSGVAKGTWQAVWEAVSKLPKPEHGGTFRAAFLDLMGELDLEGSRNLSAAEITSARDAWHRQQPLRSAMRAGVLALLPKDMIRVYDEDNVADGERVPTWGDSAPLNCYWERPRSRDGVPLEGLGLEARMTEGVGNAGALEWILWVLPTQTGKASLKRAARVDPSWNRNGEQWEHPIGDTGGPDTPFHEQLQRAVVEARSWLKRGLNVSVGKTRLPPAEPLLTGKAAAADARNAEELERQMEAWGARLSGANLADLVPRLKEGDFAKRINGTTRLIHEEREVLWFGWEWAIESEPPYFDLLVGWRTRNARSHAVDALKGWTPPEGVEPGEFDEYTARFRVKLHERDLKSAIELLGLTAHSLLSHDDQAVLRRLGAAR